MRLPVLLISGSTLIYRLPRFTRTVKWYTYTRRICGEVKIRAFLAQQEGVGDDICGSINAALYASTRGKRKWECVLMNTKEFVRNCERGGWDERLKRPRILEIQTTSLEQRVFARSGSSFFDTRDERILFN